ncbi:MAG: TolC family protein [Kiritimatiellaeota bacterium]|nr:TolC family protein [Kiritimatiellota bacterium]
MKNGLRQAKLAATVMVVVSTALVGADRIRAETAGDSRQRPSAPTLRIRPVPDRDTDENSGLPPHPTLRDCVTYALFHNSGLRAAFGTWRAAMERIPQVTALPDPKFSYSYYVREVETRVGPQRQKIGLSQTFPWFGKLRLRGDMAAKAAEAAWDRFQAQKLAVVFQVKSTWYDVYYLKRSIEVTQENFELLKMLEIVARERYRGGKALTAVMQAQVELGKLEDRLRSLRELRPALTARLNAALSRAPDAPTPWPEDIPEPDAAWSFAEFRSALERGNPELRRLSTLAEREGLAAKLAVKDRFPDMTFGISTIDTGDALNPSTPGSSRDPVMATLTINLPIWRAKYRAEQREALARRRSLRAARQDRLNVLAADARLAFYRLEDAIRKVSLYRDTLIPKAKQSLGVAQQAFQTGKVDFLVLIDAERALLEFELAFEKARVERAKRTAELEKLAGAPILDILPADKAKNPGSVPPSPVDSPRRKK